MKKILTSVAMLAFVGAVVAGATGAFFSDTEISTGNTFSAGAIDLGVDNTSYYNGALNEGTTWAIDWDISDAGDGEEPRQFFNFMDLKPGDWGEDTISLHVNNNDSYLCADVTLTSDDDNGLTEPESQVDSSSGEGEGELASHLRLVWWADDGDNVLEVGETPIHNNVPLGSGTVALADSQTNIWGENSTTTHALPGGRVRYIAKAWCFGDLTLEPVLAGQGQNPTVDGGVRCNGANETNVTQTDSVTLNVAFRAVQSRNNTGFICSRP